MRRIVRRTGLRLWPRSLAARTATVLLIGLALVQALGLTIHAFDRIDVVRLAQAHVTAERVMDLYRTVVATDPDSRATALAAIPLPTGVHAQMSDSPPVHPLTDAPFSVQRLLRVNLKLVPMPARYRPTHIAIRGGRPGPVIGIGLRL
ncbi:MAG: hypothetical protein ACRDNS_05435, partial [Trebonia sp.]